MLSNLLQIQKAAETTGELIGNKIIDKITRVSKTSPKDNSEKNEEEILRERYKSPVQRHNYWLSKIKDRKLLIL